MHNKDWCVCNCFGGGEGGDKGLEVKEGVERKDCHMFGILLSSMVKLDKQTNRFSET